MENLQIFVFKKFWWHIWDNRVNWTLNGKICMTSSKKGSLNLCSHVSLMGTWRVLFTTMSCCLQFWVKLWSEWTLMIPECIWQMFISRKFKAPHVLILPTPIHASKSISTTDSTVEAPLIFQLRWNSLLLWSLWLGFTMITTCASI